MLELTWWQTGLVLLVLTATAVTGIILGGREPSASGRRPKPTAAAIVRHQTDPWIVFAGRDIGRFCDLLERDGRTTPADVGRARRAPYVLGQPWRPNRRDEETPHLVVIGEGFGREWLIERTGDLERPV